MKIPKEIIDYYTDVLCHCFEPGGQRLAIGTSTGKLVVISRNSETNHADILMETTTPFAKPVLGLYWGNGGIFIGGKNLLYLYSTDKGYPGITATPTIKFECNFDCLDVCTVYHAAGKVFVACEDSKMRAWDIETQKIVAEFKDHGSGVDVVAASDSTVVSGGQDGKIFAYDGHLRSTKPIRSFDQGKKSSIGGIALSKNSVWLAAGSSGGPTMYSIGNGVKLGQIHSESKNKIYATAFDDKDALWWGGGGMRIYKSDDFNKVSLEMETAYGPGKIHHVYSITGTTGNKLSAAGSTNGIIFSDNSTYWNSMIHI